MHKAVRHREAAALHRKAADHHDKAALHHDNNEPDLAANEHANAQGAADQAAEASENAKTEK